MRDPPSWLVIALLLLRSFCGSVVCVLLTPLRRLMDRPACYAAHPGLLITGCYLIRPGVAYKARFSPHPSALLRPCLRPPERVPWNRQGHGRTVANRAGTALTDAVRTGLKCPPAPPCAVSTDGVPCARGV